MAKPKPPAPSLFGVVVVDPTCPNCGAQYSIALTDRRERALAVGAVAEAVSVRRCLDCRKDWISYE